MRRRNDVTAIALAAAAMLLSAVGLGFQMLTEDTFPSSCLVLISGCALLAGSGFLLFGPSRRHLYALRFALVAVCAVSLCSACVLLFLYPQHVWSIILMTLVNLQGVLVLHYASGFVSRETCEDATLTTSQDTPEQSPA